VAGLEPNATNLFLQSLARSVLTRKDSTLAVRKVLKRGSSASDVKKGPTVTSGARKATVSKPVAKQPAASGRTTATSQPNKADRKSSVVTLRRPSDTNRAKVNSPTTSATRKAVGSSIVRSPTQSALTSQTIDNRDNSAGAPPSKPSSSGLRTRPSSRAGSANRPPLQIPLIQDSADQPSASASSEVPKNDSSSATDDTPLAIKEADPTDSHPSVASTDSIALDKEAALQQLEQSLSSKLSSGNRPPSSLQNALSPLINADRH
jgi:hypothetical protein